MWGSGMNLITTVFGFVMSAPFIVFICTRIICRRLRGVELRPIFEIESGIDLDQPEHRTNGLEPAVVAAIPTMKFNHEAFKSVEDAQCSICLGEYQDKEVLRIMPKCGHNFHLLCIDVWLRKQSTCPVCRLPLQESLESMQGRQLHLAWPEPLIVLRLQLTTRGSGFYLVPSVQREMETINSTLTTLPEIQNKFLKNQRYSNDEGW